MPSGKVFQGPHQGQRGPSQGHDSRSPRLAYKPDEVADLVGLHVHSVYAAVRDGRLPAKHYGRRILISHEALEQWLAEGSDE